MCQYRRVAKAALDDLILWLKNGGEVAVSTFIVAVLIFVFLSAVK